jgi:putative transposase
VSCFRLIAAEKTNYPVSPMCRVLGVSRSGFHAWEQRAPSERALADARLSERIRGMYARSRDGYGARRIYLDLRDEGVRVGRKRVERLMRAAGLSGYVKRRKFRTTFAVPGVRVAEDLVERDFNPPASNRLWASDIEYVATWAGTLSLASVLDCFSRKVVGWALRADMQAELVVCAASERWRVGICRICDGEELAAGETLAAAVEFSFFPLGAYIGGVHRERARARVSAEA